MQTTSNRIAARWHSRKVNKKQRTKFDVWDEQENHLNKPFQTSTFGLVLLEESGELVKIGSSVSLSHHPWFCASMNTFLPKANKSFCCRISISVFWHEGGALTKRFITKSPKWLFEKISDLSSQDLFWGYFPKLAAFCNVLGAGNDCQMPTAKPTKRPPQPLECLAVPAIVGSVFGATQKVQFYIGNKKSVFEWRSLLWNDDSCLVVFPRKGV